MKENSIHICGCIYCTNDFEKWCNHYKKLGFDKIVVYTTNKDVLAIGKVKDFVECIEIPEKIPYYKQKQYTKFNYYLNHQNEFEWCLFADTDDYLMTPLNKGIHEYINDIIYFSSVNTIQIPYKTYVNHKEISYDQPNHELVNITYTKYAYMVRSGFQGISALDKDIFVGEPNFVVQLCSGEMIDNPYSYYTNADFSDGFIAHNVCNNFEDYVAKIKQLPDDFKTMISVNDFYSFYRANYMQWNDYFSEKEIDNFQKVFKELLIFFGYCKDEEEVEKLLKDSKIII